jgi:hypothetical protein
MFLPQIYPKPISFYQSARFRGDRAEAVTQDFDLDKVRLFGGDAALMQRIREQLETVKFRRRGRLEGRYVVIAGGTLAIDENGAPIKLNCDSDDDWAHSSVFSQMETLCASPWFHEVRDDALARWADLETVAGLPFLAEPYSAKNYYHFCTLFLPRVRHFDDAASIVIGVPPSHIALPFQRELVCRAFGDRLLRPCPDMTRLDDPELLFEPFTPQGLAWVRGRVGLRARRGHRLIYVARRSSMVGRHHGGVQETTEFLNFLERHRFETVDFGSGEIPVAEQIAMLDGARVIMSAHGAGLTNIAFAESGISVIELLPIFWTCFTHMQIALATSLNYFGIICSEVDDSRKMMLDLELLSNVLTEALS